MNTMDKEKKYADVFGNNPNVSLEERNRVISQIQKIGSLTFSVQRHEDGWVATCLEVEGLIAGNTNPNPSQLEIDSELREAIYSAFNVKFENIKSPIKIEYSLC
jgi:hypothetical protein